MPLNEKYSHEKSTSAEEYAQPVQIVQCSVGAGYHTSQLDITINTLFETLIKRVFISASIFLSPVDPAKKNVLYSCAVFFRL